MAILTAFTLLSVLSIFSGCDAFCGCIGSDWTPMDGVGCFKFFEEHKTFIEAQKHCRAQSLRPDMIFNLASVHSEEEYNLLKAMVPPPINGWDPQVFIGLRLKDGVTPAWTDGSFYDYQNWCRDDPNAHPDGYGAISGGSYCLGLWVDVHTFTNDQFPYICKSQCLDELGNTIA